MQSWKNLKDLQSIIEEGYITLGYSSLEDRGYRFLSSPESTLWSNRMIMSINPAGNQPDHELDGMFTPEGISSYIHERWMSAPMGSRKLQSQYQAIFALLAWDPLEVLQTPFSPYRHPSWSKIPSNIRDKTIEFCRTKIWLPYFERHCPKQIICIGKPPAEPLCSVIPHQLKETWKVPTGWNNVACDKATIYLFDNDTVMVQVPHLSRFGIMTAPSCREHLSSIFEPFLPSKT